MFFFLILIIDLYFLISAVIMEVFIVITELTTPAGIPTKEPKAEIETYPVTVQAKISTCSIQSKILEIFLCLNY